MAANQPIQNQSGVPQMPQGVPAPQTPQQTPVSTQANPFAQMQQHFQQMPAPAEPTSNLGLSPLDPNYDPNRNVITINDGQVSQTSPQNLQQQQPVQNPVQQQNPLYQQDQTQLMQNPAAQQTLDYNQLQNSLIPDANQPTDNQNVLAELIKSQTATQALLERLANQQNPSTPDYLSMDNQELQALINPEEGGSGKLRDILQSVRDQAVRDAQTQAQQQVEQLSSKMQAIERQHNVAQARMQVNALTQKYGQRDPNFQNNMLETTKFISTPKGKALLDAIPEGGLETAYLLIQAQQFNDPNYQQQLAQQATAMQNNVNMQKLQAGFGGQPATQNLQSFPQMHQTAQVSQGQSDLDIIKNVLSAGNQIAGGVPNVTVSV